MTVGGLGPVKQLSARQRAIALSSSAQMRYGGATDTVPRLSRPESLQKRRQRRGPDRSAGSRFAIGGMFPCLPKFPKVDGLVPPSGRFWTRIVRDGITGALGTVMILPQVHLRKPCYDFYFL